MNYTNRFISFTVLAAVLSGCEFNEDFCIRNGELVAWCDFSGIRETPPVPEERHIIAFPSGMDIPSGEQMTFTQDTLRQSIPQGEYQFLFYTGNYEVSTSGIITRPALWHGQILWRARYTFPACRSSAVRPVSASAWSTRGPSAFP